MNSLDRKKILLGVTGGIAAYKSAELVRRLRDRGAEVRVVMTEAATRFVGPLTFEALSGYPVRVGDALSGIDGAIGHIDLARWADGVLIAPATANFLAKLAHGSADDLLSALCLGNEAPLGVAPAMNQAMWSNPATRENVRLLSARGVAIFGPGIGSQACGEIGPGRMIEPGQLLDELQGLFETGALAGVRVMVTAGPTREAIDPVRFIANRSSGKMGYAIATAAAEAGAVVTLVSGPVQIQPPDGVECIPVESAGDMLDAVMSGVRNMDIMIAAAAVADYRPAIVADSKIKKHNGVPVIDLVPTVDIVASVTQRHPELYAVGFAAETERLEENAREKMRRKQLDMVAANRVGVPDSGFESDSNSLQVFWKGGDRVLPGAAKERIARQLVDIVARRYRERSVNKVKDTKAHAEGSAQDS